MKKHILQENYERMFGTLNEGEYDDLVGKLEKVVKKHFSNSTYTVRYSNNLLPAITIYFTLGKKSNWSNGISHNSPVKFNIHEYDLGKDKMSFEPGGIRMTAKATEKHMAYSGIKFPTRKAKVTPDVLVKKVDKLFGDLRKFIKKNYDKMDDGHKWVKKYI